MASVIHGLITCNLSQIDALTSPCFRVTGMRSRSKKSALACI